MIKNKKGFIVLGVAFAIIIGTAITLINSRIEENTKKQEVAPETKNTESTKEEEVTPKTEDVKSNFKTFTNNELNFEIDYPDTFNPAEQQKELFGNSYDYNLLLKEDGFSDLYFQSSFNVLIKTDEDSIKNCDKSYVRASKYVGEETGEDVSDYKLPKTKNINGETFYSEWRYEGDMMGTYEQISYKKLYNNKCYYLSLSFFYSSYPSKSDIAENKEQYEKIKKDRKEKGQEVVKTFEEVIKEFRFKESDKLTDEEVKKKYSGPILYDDWHYEFVHFESKNNELGCGYDNILLESASANQKFYIFDRKTDYGDFECIGSNFKFDRENSTLYFLRSYEFCSGSYYSFNLKTKKLTQMSEFDSKENVEERLANDDHCFTKFFDEFETFTMVDTDE